MTPFCHLVTLKPSQTDFRNAFVCDADKLVECVEDNSGVVGQPWATRKHALNAVIGGVTLVNQAKRLVVVPNWQKNRDLSSYTHTYGSYMTCFSARISMKTQISENIDLMTNES